MKFIESLSCPNESSVTLEERQYQTPAVLEDEAGVNFLLLTEPGQAMPIRTWTQAMSDGIGYVAAEQDGQWVFVTVERATSHRESRGQDRQVDLQDALWSPLLDFDYREVIGAQIEAESATQGVSGGTFVNLHNHSEYSLLDGFSSIKEMVEVARESGQTAIAVTDHSHPAAHPEFYNRCVVAGIKPIMGIEANLVDDRHRRGRSWVAMVADDGSHEYEVEPGSDAPKGYHLEKRSDSRQVRGGYMHITLLAMTDEGLRNLWALASVGYREGFYERPRIDWEILERYSEGVIATTGCLRGPLAVPLLKGDEIKARENVARLMDIYPDRLYVEIHVNQMEDQKIVNELSLMFAEQYSLPYFASIDSHYARTEDKFAHSVWIATQTNKSLAAEGGDLFADNQDYHMASETEVRQALAYLGDDVVEQAVRTTVEVADRCEAKIVGETEMPTFSRASEQHSDPQARDTERLIDLCLSNWDSIITPDIERGVYTLEQAEERFAAEMELIVKKGYSGYFLIVADYVKWAKDNGALVGPARGSGGGSLVARLARIIEVDPIGGDLLFSRFINAGRKELPDFDVDFPTTWREPTKTYLRERWGADYTLSIGTIQRLRIKGAIDSIMMALKGSSLPMPSWGEVTALKAADDASAQAAAGTKVSWDDFVTDHADLMDGMRDNYPEFMELLESFVGRVKTFGKHPAGMVVSTTTVLSDLPVRTGDDGSIVSIFDMDALDSLGLVKFDLLTLRTLDTIQSTLDMIKDSYGETVDLYRFGEEYDDPQVWDEISAGHTLGVFQVETKDGTRLARRHKPRNIADLTDVITIVRPGPSRSGLTDIYLDRRDGIKPVSSMHPLLDDVLGPTQGVPIFQEQVMAIAMLLAGYDETEADGIRKVLGKKQVELVERTGREFVSRSMERGVDEKVVVDLWEQLTEFAKYAFNKSHALAYAILAYWTGWLKVHYPAYYLCSLLSTVDSNRFGEFISEARRLGLDVKGPDVNESGVQFTPAGTTIRYGLASVMGVGDDTAEHIVANQPYTSVEDFRERAMSKTDKGKSPVNLGHLKALSAVGAFDTLFPNRRALDKILSDESDGTSKRCIFRDDEAVGPNGLPCTFDWDNEVDPPMVAKGRGKDKVYTPKPPPKRCTTACRNYTPPEPIDPETLAPYTDAEVRDLERELLGVWVSSSPFDEVDPQDLERMHKASEVHDGPEGHEYICVAVLESVRERRDVNGNKYAFLTMDARDGSLDAICFASIYQDVDHILKPGRLLFVALHKNHRGLQVAEIIPAPDAESAPSSATL